MLYGEWNYIITCDVKMQYKTLKSNLAAIDYQQKNK